MSVEAAPHEHPDAKKLGWLCFHCGDYYEADQIDAARAHFGPHQDSAPACTDHGSDAELLARARQAEAQLEVVRNRAQQSEDEAERLAMELSAWTDCFRRRLRFDSPSAAFHHYDFMEGRALVAMEKVDHARREMPLFLNVANCLEAGMTPKECAAELRLILARLEGNLAGGGKPTAQVFCQGCDGTGGPSRNCAGCGGTGWVPKCG